MDRSRVPFSIGIKADRSGDTPTPQACLDYRVIIKGFPIQYLVEKVGISHARNESLHLPGRVRPDIVDPFGVIEVQAQPLPDSGVVK